MFDLGLLAIAGFLTAEDATARAVVGTAAGVVNSAGCDVSDTFSGDFGRAVAPF